MAVRRSAGVMNREDRVRVGRGSIRRILNVPLASGSTRVPSSSGTFPAMENDNHCVPRTQAHLKLLLFG